MNKTIYLDNNATSRISEEVFEAMLPYLKNEFGNPSSSYTFGRKEKEAIETSRCEVAKLLNSKVEEIIFTSGSSESNVTAIKSAVKIYPNKKHIITTKMEHTSIRETLLSLEKIGYEITYLDTNELGQIDTKNLEKAIKKDTLLVVLMLANNETGTIYPIKGCSKIAHKHGVLFHADATAAIGKMLFDVSDLDVDTLSFSGHKIHAPKGIGILYIKNGTPFEPLIYGHQEENRRGGTENVPYIVGLGCATKILLKEIEDIIDSMSNLRDYLEKGLKENVEDSFIYGDIENRLSNTLNIAFKNVNAEELMLLLESMGVIVSTGSACNSKEAEPSHVLVAMNANLDEYSPIRISLSKYTTKEEIDESIKIISRAVSALRKKNTKIKKD